MNKNGFVQDVALWAIVVLVFGIIIFVGAKFNTEFTNNYQNSSASETAKNIQSDASERYHSIWDSAFMFVFFVFGLSIVLVLYYLRTTPALFFVAIILLAIMAIPIGIIGNTFDEFQNNEAISDEADQMPITGWLMSHILEIGVAFGFLAIILLFSRAGGGY